MSNFAAFAFGVLITAFIVWMNGGRRELEYGEELYLRQELAYQLGRWGMTWEMAKWVSEKVPRAWL